MQIINRGDYYNTKFYDPEDGRFVSQDTYRGEQMEPGTWNLYSKHKDTKSLL